MRGIGAADVQGLALGAQDHRDDSGVTGEPADGFGGQDRPAQGMSGTPERVGEAVVLDGDHDLGFGGRRCGPAGCRGAPAYLDQRFGAAPVGRARVTTAVGLTRVGCRGGPGLR